MSQAMCGCGRNLWSTAAAFCAVFCGSALLWVALALIAPAGALATYTRPALCSIRSVPAPSGIAVDSEDRLWVEETPHGGNEESGPGLLYEFEPAYSSCGKLAGPKPGPAPLEITSSDLLQNLAIEAGATNDFYIFGRARNAGYLGDVQVFDGEGHSVSSWANKDVYEYVASNDDGGSVAVDNSTEATKDPSACGTVPLGISECVVYITHPGPDESPPHGDGLPQGVEKLDSKGADVSFSGCATCAGYVKGNEITGTPTASFSNGEPSAVAVDAEGDIFVVGGHEANRSEIFEYRPSGEFVRAIALLGEAPAMPSFGDSETILAVDQAADHLLVGVRTAAPEGEAAIYEFDLKTGRYISRITENVKGGLLREAYALATDSHGDLYVTDSRSNTVEVYGEGHFDPSVQIGETRERTPAGAVTLGGQVNPESGINPEHSGLSECRFELVPQAQYEASGFSAVTGAEQAECEPSAGGIPADESWHSVQAHLSGLQAGTVYWYRLVAATGGGLGGASTSSAEAFTVPAAPTIVSTSVSGVSSEFASVTARVSPNGAATTYHVEYLTAAAYAANGDSFEGAEPAASTPVPDASLGAGGPTGAQEAEVSQGLSGLTPGTSYLARVVASNADGVSDGAAEPFTTVSAVVAGLPDGRAYEMLTPPDKEGAQDLFNNSKGGSIEPEELENSDVGLASQSGEKFMLQTPAAFGPSPAAFDGAYVFSREAAADRWGYRSVVPSTLGAQNLLNTIFDPLDFSQVGLNDSIGTPANAAGTTVTSLLGGVGGPYSTLHVDHAVSPLTASGGGEDTQIVAGSRDLSTVVLESRGHELAPGLEGLDPGVTGLYEVHSGGACGPEGHECAPVDVTSAGTPVSPCGASLGSGMDTSSGGYAYHAVSADGSKVFFTAPEVEEERLNTSTPQTTLETKGCWNGAVKDAPQLYMRTGGETIEISEPEEGVSNPTGIHPAAYVGAAENGSRVYFTTRTDLTQNAEGLTDPELYEYNTETDSLARVSAGESGTADGDVYSIAAVSADGSTVYFTANGVLAPGASPGDCSDTEETGTCNLYRYEAPSAGRPAHTSFVAVVESRSFGPPARDYDIPIAPTPRFTRAYSTADGRYLLFGTDSELTGYDTRSSATCPSVKVQKQEDALPIEHCEELYRYSAQAAEEGKPAIVCVSCNPSGARPTADALFSDSALTGPDSGPVPAMSENGAYVFFNTTEALVPQDTNATGDVYEWHEGTISLISSGTNPYPSFFLGYSAYTTPEGERVEGGNVFIGTHAKLVPQDVDSQGDLYDARICLPQSPCLTPPGGETAQCEGDACQVAPPPPVDQTPGSLTFSGPGNVAAAPDAATSSKGQAKAPAAKETLSRALQRCHRYRARRRRAACERRARKRLGAAARRSGENKARRGR